MIMKIKAMSLILTIVLLITGCNAKGADNAALSSDEIL